MKQAGTWRGFASLDSDKQREIAVQGGKASVQSSQNQRRPRGFAAMSAEKRREIAGMGGRSAHQQGRAHKWTREEASQAGRVGGTISKRRPRFPREVQ